MVEKTVEGPEGDDEIDVRELEKRLEAEEESPYLLDIREPWEWEVANLGDRGAELIPMRQLPNRLEDLPDDRDIVVYCRSGSRSDRVASYLRDQGFERAMNLEGGILAWTAEIDSSLETY